MLNDPRKCLALSGEDFCTVIHFKIPFLLHVVCNHLSSLLFGPHCITMYPRGSKEKVILQKKEKERGRGNDMYSFYGN